MVCEKFRLEPVADSDIGPQGPGEGMVFRFRLGAGTGNEQLYVQATGERALTQFDEAERLAGESIDVGDSIAPGGSVLLFWQFTTMNSLEVFPTDVSSAAALGGMDIHPVSGNRVFGFYENSQDELVFFTSGVDRTSDALAFTVMPEVVFSGAHRKWTGLQENLVERVERDGGSASVGRVYSQRF